MQGSLDRRRFAKTTFGFGMMALADLQAQTPTAPKKLSLKIGVSTLAWNVSPNDSVNFEQALRDISELGYWGFETVSPMIEALDANGMLPKLMDKYQIPMKAGYLGTNITDLSARKDNLANVIRVAKLVKKYGGTYVVIAANSRRPPAAGKASGARAGRVQLSRAQIGYGGRAE